jgi:HEAT repeat protein
MIAFCTHCWAEINAEDRHCPSCGSDLSVDSRSYEEKLIAALGHPLPEARVRICWLLGEKHIVPAVPRLIELAQRDQDLFVQRAAVEALGTIQDQRALAVLKSISESQNHFLRTPAIESLKKFRAPEESRVEP